MVAIYAVSVTIGLALFWGAGSWLKWQHMKMGTIIPRGSLTGKYGHVAAVCIKWSCVAVLVLLAVYWVWWAVALVVPVWFLGNWAATLLERVLYCDDSRLDTFVFAAEEYSRELGPGRAARTMSEVAPKWWIKLMPARWRERLRAKLVPILLPNGEGAAGE
jgi:hypothetical protein